MQQSLWNIRIISMCPDCLTLSKTDADDEACGVSTSRECFWSYVVEAWFYVFEAAQTWSQWNAGGCCCVDHSLAMSCAPSYAS